MSYSEAGYSAALLRQTEQFGELIYGAGSADLANLSLPVPTCPDWTLEQLFRHVGRGHRWAAQMISERVERPLDPRTVRDGKPPNDPAGALEWLRGSARAVLDAVERVGAETPAWTFLGPRPASWWIRRRLHEATVHRADAALARNLPFELPAELAADGISEWLDLVAGGRRGDGPPPLEPGASIYLRATDDGLGSAGEWAIRGTDSGLAWQHAHADAQVALHGSARDLLLAILRRQTIEELGIEPKGERTVWTTWLDRTPF